MKISLLFKGDATIKIPGRETLSFRKGDVTELDSFDFDGEKNLQEVIKELIKNQAAYPTHQHGPVVRMHG